MRVFIKGETGLFKELLREYLSYNDLAISKLHDASSNEIAESGLEEKQIDDLISVAWQQMPEVCRRIAGNRVPNYYLIGRGDTCYLVLCRRMAEQLSTIFAQYFNEAAKQVKSPLGLELTSCNNYERSYKLYGEAKDMPDTIGKMLNFFEKSIYIF